MTTFEEWYIARAWGTIIGFVLVLIISCCEIWRRDVARRRKKELDRFAEECERTAQTGQEPPSL